MPIKVTFDPDKVVRGAIEKFWAANEERIIYAFRRACLEAVNYAKGKDRDSGPPRYTDQSGALNSSTGFHLYKRGELIEQYFVGTGTGQAEGIAAGKRAAAEAATPSSDKLVTAVIVAGMHYAIYVEAKQRDVLTGTELKFPAILERWLKEAFEGRDVPFIITDE